MVLGCEDPSDVLITEDSLKKFKRYFVTYKMNYEHALLIVARLKQELTKAIKYKLMPLFKTFAQ